MPPMALTRRFAFRLCLELGWPNPDALLASIPWRIFEEWIQYHGEEPFGQMPFRTGFAISGLGNMWRDRGQRILKATDFMPDVRYDPQQGARPRRRGPGKTADQQVAHLMLISRQMGWTVIDKRSDKKKKAGTRADSD